MSRDMCKNLYTEIQFTSFSQWRLYNFVMGARPFQFTPTYALGNEFDDLTLVLKTLETANQNK